MPTWLPTESLGTWKQIENYVDAIAFSLKAAENNIFHSAQVSIGHRALDSRFCGQFFVHGNKKTLKTWAIRKD